MQYECGVCGAVAAAAFVVALLNFEILKLFFCSLSGPCGAFCYLGHFKKLRIIIIIITRSKIAIHDYSKILTCVGRRQGMSI